MMASTEFHDSGLRTMKAEFGKVNDMLDKEISELQELLARLSKSRRNVTAKRDSSTDMHVLVLQSSMAGNRNQTANSDMSLTILRAKGIEPVVIDASNQDNKNIRDELFQISGRRGNYPQVFKVVGTKTSFLGDFDSLQGMNEDGSLTDLASSMRFDDAVGSDEVGLGPPPKSAGADSTNSGQVEADGAESSSGEEGSSDEDGDESIVTDNAEEKDGSLETITIASKKDIDAPNQKGVVERKKWTASLFGKRHREVENQSYPEVEGGDAAVAATIKDFGTEIDTEQAWKHRKLIKVLLVAGCLFLVFDIVLVVLLVVK